MTFNALHHQEPHNLATCLSYDLYALFDHPTTHLYYLYLGKNYLLPAEASPWLLLLCGIPYQETSGKATPYQVFVVA